MFFKLTLDRSTTKTTPEPEASAGDHDRKNVVNEVWYAAFSIMSKKRKTKMSRIINQMSLSVSL